MDETQSAIARIYREVAASNEPCLLAYLHGAARDGTFNRRHATWRISQSDQVWLQILQRQIALLGRKAWIYREGSRQVWALETKLDLSEPALYGSRSERLAFARGYFDAEGGVPRSPKDRFYIQLVQKDLPDLSRLHSILTTEGIACGRLHNPSRRVDPDFWRFYVSASSLPLFVDAVGSWHPRKRAVLTARFEQVVSERAG
jgi:hypothetical protein